jgi:hypothetical protein
MSSKDYLKMMSEFISTVEDPNLIIILKTSISKKHPFRKFKNIINSSGPFKKNWYDFKEQKYCKYIEQQIEIFNRNEIIKNAELY